MAAVARLTRLEASIEVEAAELVRERALHARFHAGRRGEDLPQGDATVAARIEVAAYLRTLADRIIGGAL